MKYEWPSEHYNLKIHWDSISPRSEWKELWKWMPTSASKPTTHLTHSSTLLVRMQLLQKSILMPLKSLNKIYHMTKLHHSWTSAQASIAQISWHVNVYSTNHKSKPRDQPRYWITEEWLGNYGVSAQGNFSPLKKNEVRLFGVNWCSWRW